MNFLDAFIEDCKYYDPKKVEPKTIIKNVNLKDKTILDMGTGIGRLAFPLSKYAKRILALDKDKRFKKYFDEHKNKKIKFVNQTAEKFLQNRKFDIILLAWPTLNFNLRFINLVKRAMNKDSKFVFITCDNDSDFEMIPKKLETGRYFDKDIKNKRRFINFLPKKFKLILKKRINTGHVYPNKNTAFRVIKNSVKLWFKIKFNKKREKKLKEIIGKHKKGKKVIFGEKIWFYLMEK